jgi:hypothetical protein
MGKWFDSFFMRTLTPELYTGFKEKLNSRLEAELGDYPCTDRLGNPVANIGVVSIKDFYFTSRNESKQDRFMRKYHLGMPVLLVLDPINKVDVHLLTTRGKQLGLLPDEGEFTERIHKRLLEDYEVFAQIFNYKQLLDYHLSCEIRIVCYVTPFDSGISKPPQSRIIILH